ncbi:Short-chain dehydrogenase/reductase aba4 [Cadophora sp. M221]|nr:Short-chain dehydrogenase/reductase aba4 [Cadophora sp. M221]
MSHIACSPLQFSGKVIAITGAASGIGLETAQLLASRGATLSLADVQEVVLLKVQRQLQSEFRVDVLITTLDVRNWQQVDAWVKATIERFGTLDGAANLAGVIPKSLGKKNIGEQDLDEWDQVLGINLTGLMHCLRAQLKAMAAKHSGTASVVTASSIAGTTGRRNNASYTASKHGVLGLTRTAAKEFGAMGIRVNAICPHWAFRGRIITPMLKSAEDALGISVSPETPGYPDIALRRDGEPKEVAQLIAFLLSDESSYISGADISIDGGWRC